MLHLYDRASMARAMTLELDPSLRTVLAERLSALATADHDLSGSTEYLIVEAGDTENDIINIVGFSPLIEPIDGVRFGSTDFHPFWDYLALHKGWYEMIVTVGNSGFAYIFLVEDAEGIFSEIRDMCQFFIHNSIL